MESKSRCSAVVFALVHLHLIALALNVLVYPPFFERGYFWCNGALYIRECCTIAPRKHAGNAALKF